MSGYCEEALTRFRHELRTIMDQPHMHAVPVYGSKIQYAKGNDKATKLGKEDKLFIQ